MEELRKNACIYIYIYILILSNCPTWRTNSFQYIYLFIVLCMFRACHAHHQEKQIVSTQHLVIVTPCWWQCRVLVGSKPSIQIALHWFNGFNTFYPSLNTFNSFSIPHKIWLYTLWDPILYAHWRHLLCISWPEDCRNEAETCCQEPLICSN